MTMTESVHQESNDNNRFHQKDKEQDLQVTTTTTTTTTTTSTASTNFSSSSSSSTSSHNQNRKCLLSTVQSLVKLEMSLTQSLSDIQPLLDELATPQNMSQVHTILSLARSYSTKTSAPPGWNPNLPVIHFSTPNPLPHQLRQGELGAMELQMVKEERNRKRKKIQKEKMQQKALQESERRNSQVLQKDRAHDPKKREIMDHVQMDNEETEKRKEEKKKLLDRNAKRLREPNSKTAPATMVPTSMNLSDDSSSSEEEEDDDDGSD
jgi:hypothetical protein